MSKKLLKEIKILTESNKRDRIESKEGGTDSCFSDDGIMSFYEQYIHRKSDEFEIGENMRIKVAVLDTDENYKSRLLSNLQIKFADKLELYVFSSIGQLNENLKEKGIEMVLADSGIPYDKEALGQDVLWVYLAGAMEIEEIDGIPAICKFQKVETIYKQILSIYAEHASHMKMRSGNSSARTILFLSAQGGSGTSAAAAAYALRMARNGEKVFYLNLEQLGNPDQYFQADGMMSFSDVVYALKSRKSNFLIKLESASKTDKSGVDFFSGCRNAYDMCELTDEEIGRLIQGIDQIKEYDRLVIDISERLTVRAYVLMNEYADQIVCVGDGSTCGNQKLERFCEILKVQEERTEQNLLGKMLLLYNRFSSKSSSQMSEPPVPVLGGINRYEGIAGRELIEQISGKAILDQI